MRRSNTYDISITIKQLEQIMVDIKLNKTKRDKILNEIKAMIERKKPLAQTLKALAPGIDIS